MEKLTEREERELIRAFNRENASFRFPIAIFMIIMQVCIVCVNVMTKRYEVEYNYINMALVIIAIIDLIFCFGYWKYPDLEELRFRSWSYIYGVLVLIWSVYANIVEIRHGSMELSFLIFIIIVLCGVRMTPMLETIAFSVVFLLNFFVITYINERQMETGTLIGYCGIYLIVIYIGILLYNSSLKNVRAMLANEDKSELLHEANAELYQINKDLEKSAQTDALTGLGNRMESNQILENYWEKKIPFTIAFIDLDNLKFCNDTYGHEEGDEYILGVCRELAELCKPDEGIYRIGGDEFLMISKNATEEELDERLEEARKKYLEKNREKDNKYPHSFSYGCAHRDPESPRTYSDLLSIADQKMYRYKMTRSRKWEFGKADAARPELLNQINRAGLDSRVFEVIAATSRKRYIYLCNIQTQVSRWSQNALLDFELPSEYMYDSFSIWKKLIHPDDEDMYEKDLEMLFSGQKNSHNMQYRVMNREGRYVVCSCEGYVLKGENGEPGYFAGTITNHGVIENVDPVTSLYNVYELQKTLQSIREEQKPVTLVMIGINQFGVLNNSYDYQFGNDVLRCFAELLYQKVKSDRGGQVFRIDGAKFALLFEEEFPEDEILEIYRDICEVAHDNIEMGNLHIRLTLSGGAVVMPVIMAQETTLMSEASYALTISKTKNNGSLVFYNNHNWSDDQKHMEMLDDIKNSIHNNYEGFYLNYQPQVNADMEMLGAEELIRWKSSKWGVVYPGDFIAVLENDRCFYDLGLWVLRTAIRDAKEMLQFNPKFWISVNISYQQLRVRRFREDVMGILEELDFPPENLVLEMTEHSRRVDMPELRENLEFFRSKGIRTAVDDFGTGYSSIRVLRDLTFNSMKIDKSFIHNIQVSQDDQLLVQILVDATKKMNLHICVEGVETIEEFEILKSFGTDYYQGYYFSRPVDLKGLHDYSLLSRL